MAKAPKPEVREILDILNNPKDKAALHSFIDEAVRCKTKIQFENESIKGIRESALNDIGIDPKLFGQLVNISYKNNFMETQKSIDSLDSAIEMLFNTGD